MFKAKDKYNIAIVGATGIVGESLLEILSSLQTTPIQSKKSSKKNTIF